MPPEQEPVDLTGPWPIPDADCRRGWGQAATLAAAEDSAWQTSPADGDEELRTRLGLLLDVPREQVLVTAGIRAAAVVLARGASRVLVECPTFAGVPSVFRALGVEVRLATWERLPDEQRRWRPDLVWVTSPYRNPDGHCLPEDLLDTLRAGDSRVVVNEAYRWWLTPPARPGCTTVGSFSKLTGGGARVGWITGPDRPVPRPPDNATAPARLLQRTWAHFLADDGVARCQQAVVEPTVAASAGFRGAFGSPRRRTDAPFVLLRARDGAPEQHVADAFAREGMRVGLGSAFHAPATSVRLCFTGVTPPQATRVGRRARQLVDEGLVELA